ncbi:MAG: hypothetical protein VM34scaffold347_14 [Phage 66_12]|nr:MAG: hypothetical protein VM34scaffold347_14 [Phage 66_12]
MDDLGAWWAQVASQDAAEAGIKAKEYGSLDLVMIGAALREMGVRAPMDVADSELGVTFYAFGKMARVISALSEGRVPSDDTWHDITVYSTMVRRIRETGQWP